MGHPTKKVWKASDYRPGTIGHAWATGEQAGRDAWLAGIELNQCPYTKYEHTLERAGWHAGWIFMDNDYQEIEAKQ